MNGIQCPECGVWLSRKQRLQSHQKAKHNITAQTTYKRYKVDPSVRIPRTTSYRQALLQTSDDSISLHNDPIDQTEKNVTELGDSTIVNLEIEREIKHFEQNNESIAEQLNPEYDQQVLDDQERSSDYSIHSDSDDSLTSDFSDGENSDQGNFDLNVELTETEERYMSILSYASRHCLNQEATNDLLRLMSLHNEDTSLDVSSKKLKESLGALKSNIHDFCTECFKLFPKDETVVTCSKEGCSAFRYKGDENSQYLKRRKSYFVSADIASQISDILKKDKMYDIMIKYKQKCEESENLTDILNGEVYKNMTFDNTGGCVNITLMFNTDGVPLYNSSKISIWPVYLVINELPPSLRFSRQNMILWGVWQSKGKPNFHTFLTPFVEDIISLKNVGFVMNNRGQEFNMKATLIAGSVDLQAKAMLLNMNHHNGEYGCITCEEKGEVVKQGQGHTRVYPCREEAPTLRNSQAVLQCGMEAARDTRKGIVKSIKGVSILHAMSWFCVVTSMVPDYMHSVLLGVAKMLLTLMFSSAKSGSEFFIGKSIKDVDRILLRMKPTDSIGRLPRPIEHHFHHYKASELQTWLLFYSLPCLIEFLKEDYRNHLALMIEGIYLLLGDDISNENLIRAEQVLLQFYQAFPNLYGVNNMTLNLHNMCIHLPYYVKKLGPIWAWSCFAFEDMNGSVLERLHGTGNVCQQILWNVHIQKRLGTDSKYIKDAGRKEFVHRMMQGQRQVRVKHIAENCNIAGGKSVIILTAELKQKLAAVLGTEVERVGSVYKILRIIRKEEIIYSEQYKRLENRISNIVSVNIDGNTVIASVQYFLLHKISNKCYAVVKVLQENGLLNPIVHHLKSVNPDYQNNEQTVILVDQIQEKLIYLGGNFQHCCVSRMPNKYGLCG